MRNRTNYPANWFDTIRPDILRRDNYKCTKCGIAHRSYIVRDNKGIYSEISQEQFVQFREEGKKTFKVYLQVAHMDNDVTNLNYSNLKALCPVCHLLNDAEFKNLMRLAKVQPK